MLFIGRNRRIISVVVWWADSRRFVSVWQRQEQYKEDYSTLSRIPQKRKTFPNQLRCRAHRTPQILGTVDGKAFFNARKLFLEISEENCPNIRLEIITSKQSQVIVWRWKMFPRNTSATSCLEKYRNIYLYKIIIKIVVWWERFQVLLGKNKNLICEINTIYQCFKKRFCQKITIALLIE